MNKITPHKLRELNESLPNGTECYLCDAVRNALKQYRKGFEPNRFLNKDEAVYVLITKLGRGLKRYFQPQIRQAL